MSDSIHILSLGAGVQSSTLALMAAVGEVTPMPKAAIFADTQAEPASVYKWLDWLEGRLPFPVRRVTKGSLEEMALSVRTSATGKRYTKHGVPAFLLDARGKAEFERAAQWEVRLQRATSQVSAYRGTPYLHRSLKPLREVDLTDYSSDQGELFGNECEGMCGV